MNQSCKIKSEKNILEAAPTGANKDDVRLATQVQARTQQRAAATGQLIHCLLVVAHGWNLAGVRHAVQVIVQ
jgi:hypothetical protein